MLCLTGFELYSRSVPLNVTLSETKIVKCENWMQYILLQLTFLFKVLDKIIEF